MVEPALRQVGNSKKRRNSSLETSKEVLKKKMKCENEISQEVDSSINNIKNEVSNDKCEEYDQLKSNFSKLTSNGFNKNGANLNMGKPGCAKKLVIKNLSS